MLLGDLLIRSTDRTALERFIARPVGSLLLVAPKGYGKETLARVIALSIVPPEASQTFYKELKPSDKGAISVDEAREIKDFFKLKTLSTDAKRVVVIYDADSMTIEAQNALLKIIEEPPKNCFFVMTTSAPERLLPTVLSRVWRLDLKTPTKAETEKFMVAQGFSSLDVARVLPLSDGLPAVTLSLLKGVSSDLTVLIEGAKTILTSTPFERLCQVDAYAKDRQKALLLIQSLLKVSSAALDSQLAKSKPADHWRRIIRTLLDAQRALESNAQVKLVLTDAMLNL